ncbi:uncharacterized protein V6R79_024354 [Siganus canaliculatus]
MRNQAQIFSTTPLCFVCFRLVYTVLPAALTPQRCDVERLSPLHICQTERLKIHQQVFVVVVVVVVGLRPLLCELERYVRDQQEKNRTQNENVHPQKLHLWHPTVPEDNSPITASLHVLQSDSPSPRCHTCTLWELREAGGFLRGSIALHQCSLLMKTRYSWMHQTEIRSVPVDSQTWNKLEADLLKTPGAGVMCDPVGFGGADTCSEVFICSLRR